MKMDKNEQNLTIFTKFNPTKLTRKQRAFLSICPGNGNITELCERAGVTRSSFYTWIEKSPEFRAAYGEVYKNTLSELANRLVSLGGQALETLAGGMTSDKESLRVKSAALVLSNLVSLKNVVDIEDRLTALEIALASVKRQAQ